MGAIFTTFLQIPFKPFLPIPSHTDGRSTCSLFLEKHSGRNQQIKSLIATSFGPYNNSSATFGICWRNISNVWRRIWKTCWYFKENVKAFFYFAKAKIFFSKAYLRSWWDISSTLRCKRILQRYENSLHKRHKHVALWLTTTLRETCEGYFCIVFKTYSWLSPSMNCSRNIFSPSNTAYEKSWIQSPRMRMREERLNIKSSIMWRCP